MPISDALIVGEDWISEHYFTTDATKESFQARVLDRRKAWDAAEEATTRSRFLSRRGELERALVALSGAIDGDDSGPGGHAAVDEDGVRDVADWLLDVLGYRTGQWRLVEDGPLVGVSSPDAELVDEVLHAPLVILKGRPVAAFEELVAKNAGSDGGGTVPARTLLQPWEREDQDPVVSVASALSTLMTEAEGPSYALVLAGRWALVAEKERWPEGRWLAIDLQLVAERNDTRKGGEIDRALICIDAQSLAPDAAGGVWWRETLEASVKHTVGVSKDLQEGVRTSIEIIANEVVKRRRDQGLDPLPDDQANELAKQCLRYLYRILFLLYAEASPELGVLPVGASEYDAGYGLDRLRDLALTEIHEDRSRQGTHLYHSLETLFRLVNEGHTPAGPEGTDDGLTFNGLSADLFLPEKTRHIDEVRLGNDALLKVLRKLLLSKEQGKQQRGFISYVELGINQLGAVYEGLMSYTGSFASEDLYEVARDGDPSKGSWVVPITRSDHLDGEHFVRRANEDTGEMEPVTYRQGEFVFRLSGRDRQRSASYYTPEVLTKFTVQQALEELLDQDGHTTTAKEVLGLTICEPALGSGAFAIEAVRQLAEEYVSRRERELGEKVDPDRRPQEVQKVKAYIALHQAYGVDLNATAVELAEVSLWLDTMVAGLQAPWFGLRLRRGNSLVGARRALYPERMIKDKTWLTEPPLDESLVGLAAAVDRGDELDLGVLSTRVHHFLLPAKGWGSAVEVPKSVRDLIPDSQLTRLKTWRKGVRAKPTAAQLKRLQALAIRVEKLWGITLRRLRIAEGESSRAIDLWGRPAPAERHAVTRAQIEESLADPDGAYRRLKLVMDAWCALWYWPLTEFETAPPSFGEWLDACEDILGRHDTRARAQHNQSFTSASDWDALNVAEELELGMATAQPVAAVRDRHPWIVVCERVAEAQAFFHWELQFATVFARGGFDLQVGNPPWVRPDVNIEDLLAEGDPWWALALKPSESAKSARRPNTLRVGGTWRALVDGSSDVSVLGDVLSDHVMYPLLSGRPDLYRAFMCQVWAHGSSRGISALIHLESHFTDDKATALRRETYRRLRRHWQFINELVLFDIDHHNSYGVNVYGGQQDPAFLHATSLYHPDTVDRSRNHDGSGDEPGLKDSEGRWDVRPHSGRIQTVTSNTLRLWKDVLGADTAASTPMVYTVNSAAARTLATLSRAPRLRGIGLEFSAGWNEKTDREKGWFVSRWGQVEWRDAILQGPHLHVSTPLYKSPNATLKNNQDWSATDLEALVVDAKPVTAYKPAGDRDVYDRSYTHWRVTDDQCNEDIAAARDHYRVAWRRMAANTGERTLTPAIVPPGAAHVHPVTSAGLPTGKIRYLIIAQGVMSTLLSDFSLRSAPKNDIHGSTINRLPLVPLDHLLIGDLLVRALRLNCVTEAYANLWAECWEAGFSSYDSILPRHDERPIGPQWSADTPLRRAVDRRNAQVEIDALVALMLGVPVDDLCTIYRTQFAVLYGYDHREYTYDRNGRLVPNQVLALWRKRGEPQDDTQMPAEDRTAVHPGSGIAYTYELPFGILDREADFRAAYAEFERRLAGAEASDV